MKTLFDHEKLDVYQESIAFCGWVGEFLDTIPQKTAAKDQLDRASTSIPLNIAEGNGKFSERDRARFLEVARRFATDESVMPAKKRLVGIVQMLVGLLRRFSERADVLREDEGEYRNDYEHAHEQEHESQ